MVHRVIHVFCFNDFKIVYAVHMTIFEEHHEKDAYVLTYNMPKHVHSRPETTSWRWHATDCFLRFGPVTAGLAAGKKRSPIILMQL
uniref:Uncharacterized protein n=1 Tax=Arundo donax TaxID=35708 RepID=A0A0A9HJM0_ARUDO